MLIGMSIAHEVIVACHSGMTVFAFSLITNICPTTYDSTLVADHEEVMNVGKSRESMVKEFVSRMILHMQSTGGK
jgi:purine-nucleoside phosphorylase